jgi:hypothetical protein
LLQSALPAADDTHDVPGTTRGVPRAHEAHGPDARPRDLPRPHDLPQPYDLPRPQGLPRSPEPRHPAPTSPAPSLSRSARGGHPAIGVTPTAAPPTLRALRLRETAAEAGDGELPRRVRQSHLVPQLREAPRREEPRGAAPADDGPAHRTPELVRDRMTAYRNGWTRGGGSVPGPAAPGTEGDHA